METCELSIRHVPGAVSSITDPRLVRISSMTATSRICGTLASSTGPSASKVAASMGKAAFLLPPGTSVPWIGLPPWMM